MGYSGRRSVLKHVAAVGRQYAPTRPDATPPTALEKLSGVRCTVNGDDAEPNPRRFAKPPTGILPLPVANFSSSVRSSGVNEWTRRQSHLTCGDCSS